MTVNCDVCGDEFTPARSDARYCSGRCRTQAHRLRHEGPSRPRRRRPLPEAFWETTYDLQRKSESLERLATDDRFTRNAQALSGHRSDLIRTVERLQRVVDQIPEPEPLRSTRL